jgi:nucleotide-binding universal stress UspA family protein
MKALLIVDGTESSTRAVEEVRRTAWPVGAKFLVLAVAPRFFIPPPPASMLTILSGNWPGWRDPVSRASVLVHLAVEMLKERGLEAVGKVRVGRARRQILKEARESFADLILIGSHGISAPRRLLWGGDLASFLVARAPCSVEVIRANRTRGLARTHDRGAARGGPWLLSSRPHGVISG